MKLLFASLPADGHFNPLTGIAVHLRERGHDVRFYTGPSYAKKLGELGIPHFSYQRAENVNAENLTELFPEYSKMKGPAAIEFSLLKVFFGNLEAHYLDMLEIRDSFPFDALICDGAVYAAQLVAEKLRTPVYPIFPAPTPVALSRTAPPPFFGLQPARSFLGRIRDRIVLKLLNSSMKKGMALLDEVKARHGLSPYRESIFDLPYKYSRMVFQVGVPGMDFPRDDWPSNMRFVGPLMPHKKPRERNAPHEEKLAKYPTMICVSQGTIDNRDPEKLFVPTLEALRGGPHLVVATTGGRHTADLRARFPDDNVLVEDYIDFDVLLDRAALFVCNGGYGSIMQALVKGVPILSAGKLEGKNDINARLGYRGLGLDLGTERPTAKQIMKGVERVLSDPSFKQNVARVREELRGYKPFEIIEQTITQ